MKPQLAALAAAALLALCLFGYSEHQRRHYAKLYANAGEAVARGREDRSMETSEERRREKAPRAACEGQKPKGRGGGIERHKDESGDEKSSEAR